MITKRLFGVPKCFQGHGDVAGVVVYVTWTGLGKLISISIPYQCMHPTDSANRSARASTSSSSGPLSLLGTLVATP